MKEMIAYRTILEHTTFHASIVELELPLVLTKKDHMVIWIAIDGHNYAKVYKALSRSGQVPEANIRDFVKLKMLHNPDRFIKACLNPVYQVEAIGGELHTWAGKKEIQIKRKSYKRMIIL